MPNDMMKQNLPLAWTAVCALAEIVPNTGVNALLGGQQVAVFHVVADGAARVFAIANYDPNCEAAVLSRGLVGSIGEQIVVASPIYKQHFNLETGACLEAPQHAVATWPARIEAGQVWVAL